MFSIKQDSSQAGVDIDVWKGEDLSVFSLTLEDQSEVRGEIPPGSVFFCFQLNGRSTLRIGKKQSLEMNSYQYFASRDPGNSLRLIAGSRANVVFVVVSHWSFQKMLGSDAQAIRFSDELQSMSVPMNAGLQEISRCEWPELSKRIFVKAKFLGLLSHIIFEEGNRKRQYIRSDYDMERILFARDYLLQRIAMPPTIPELARISGINEFKLKMGFREVFNNSVYGFLSDTRLEMAKKEMQGTRSLTEIAFELGYSSNQHFSIAFKKKYGVSPNKLRR
ncbi:MAG: helix-turn-helix transcriptional regulator [Bacteroidia bacterium]